MAENLMEYIFHAPNHLPVFSLKKIALMRITTFLCNNQHVIGSITNCQSQTVNQIYNTRIDKNFKIIKDKADEIILKMPAIAIYEDMILNFLWHVAYRIILWKHLYASTIDNKFLRKFYWTNRGRIDNERTAQYLIANKSIPVTKRFKLACILCLDQKIFELFKNMSPEERPYLLSERDENLGPLGMAWINAFIVSRSTTEDDLDVAWLKVVKALDNIEDELEELLKYAIEIGSIEAFKYLFSKIPENMKSDKAIFCFDGIVEKLRTCYFFQEEESDMGFFILSQMSEANKEVFFTSNFQAVLSILVYSSDRNVFLEAWNYGLSFASVSDIKNVYDIKKVLFLIFRMYHNEVFRDQDYGMLFFHAWRLLPAAFRDYFRNESVLGVLCLRALLQDDLKFILLKGSPITVENLNISSTSTKYIGFQNEKLEFLHSLIREEIITTKNVEKNKAYIEIFFPVESCKRFIQYVWDKNKKKKE